MILRGRSYRTTRILQILLRVLTIVRKHKPDLISKVFLCGENLSASERNVSDEKRESNAILVKSCNSFTSVFFAIVVILRALEFQ